MKIRHRCAICEWVDPSRDIAPTAICCKYNHEPIKNIGAFTNCYGFVLDPLLVPNNSNLTIKDYIQNTPIRVKCPICGEVFEGVFGASEVFDHFEDEHKDNNIQDYLPIEFERPSWINKHSVNCIKCGDLFDEREGHTPEDGEGTVCPKCSKEIEVK